MTTERLFIVQSCEKMENSIKQEELDWSLRRRADQGNARVRLAKPLMLS